MNDEIVKDGNDFEVKFTKKKKHNRANIYLKIELSNVPIGLEPDEYWTYLEDDIEDRCCLISGVEVLETFYLEEHDDKEGKWVKKRR